MERKRYILIISLLLISVFSLRAEYRSEIYSAFITGKMEIWKDVIDRMETTEDKSNGFIMELVNYQYGYIAWCIGANRNREARKYLDIAEDNISLLERRGFSMSMVNSYKAAFYGYRIGLNVLKAPFIGPKSVECAKEAMKLDPSNPFGYIQYGNTQYYMPAIFGGSKEEALQYYLKAEELMVSDEEYNNQNWNYLNLLITIAQAYSELHDPGSSKDYYEKILNKEPSFEWVKEDLYKEILNNMKN